jgi:hypothetical protein
MNLIKEKQKNANQFSGQRDKGLNNVKGFQLHNEVRT